jgi:hypothetical protein
LYRSTAQRLERLVWIEGVYRKLFFAKFLSKTVVSSPLTYLNRCKPPSTLAISLRKYLAVYPSEIGKLEIAHKTKNQSMTRRADLWVLKYPGLLSRL